MAKKHVTRKEIKDLDKIWNINFFNSITGFKPANLIGTKSPKNLDNLAIFSSIVHIGSNPPLIGFTLRPQDEKKTDTYNNLTSNPYFTINSIGEKFFKDSHNTSKKYPSNVSEFDELNIERFNLKNFNAPFVNSSQIKIGLKKIDEHLLINNCILIIGSIEHIIINQNLIEDDGNINFDLSDILCISGLNSYLKPSLVEKLTYIKSSK